MSHDIKAAVFVCNYSFTIEDIDNLNFLFSIFKDLSPMTWIYAIFMTDIKQRAIFYTLKAIYNIYIFINENILTCEVRSGISLHDLQSELSTTSR